MLIGLGTTAGDNDDESSTVMNNYAADGVIISSARPTGDDAVNVEIEIANVGDNGDSNAEDVASVKTKGIDVDNDSVAAVAKKLDTFEDIPN